MPAESAASGERFARDMRRIRESRDVTLDDIHEETRIAGTLISAFEQDGLFEHPAFNRVYLRSFVRAYAGCIGLDQDLVIQHLERALDGEYQNELAAQILGDAPKTHGGDETSQVSETKEPDVTERSSQQVEEPKTFSPRPVGTSSSDQDVEEDSSYSGTPSRQPGNTDVPGGSHPEKSDSDVEGEERSEEKQEPREGDAPQHIADSNVSVSEQARLDTGDVFNKRPVSKGDESEDAGDSDEAREQMRSAEEPDAVEPSDDADEKSDTEPEKEPTGFSPSERFQTVNEGDEDSPPPPAHGEMVGRPRPVGSSTDPKRAEATSRPSVDPLTKRERQDRASRDATGTSATTFGDNRRSIMIGGGIVGLILIAGLVWLLLPGESDTVQDSPVVDAPTDTTTQTEEPVAPERPPLANLALGDTLYLVLRAEQDVTPIRVQRDNDLRRPYWISEGESAIFPFTERIIVWDNLENVDVLLEDFPYPEDTDARGRLVVTRDSAETFADTIRGRAAEYEVTPDTFRLSPEGLR